MTRLLLLLSFLLAYLASTHAQTTTGTEFWLGYMENLTLDFNDDPAFAIIINTDAPTEGSIDVVTTGLTIPFSVGVGSTEIFLPEAIFYSTGSETIDNKALRITTDTPVRVDAYHYRIYFSESTSLLPTTELGTDYLVQTIMDDQGNIDPASLVIVATADGTEVEITPNAITLGLRPPGIPFTITLDAGQNYQIQSLGELSGTRVTSLNGAPIAVFSGARQANITDGNCPGGADSHVWDQSLPLEDWRTLYYFVPFAGQGGDRIQVMAAEDNTTLYFNCNSVATLNSGEFLSTFVTEPTVITSTAPVSVTQYTNGFSCEPLERGDPNGLSYLPADFASTNFRWYASDRASLGGVAINFNVHFVTIVGPTTATTNVTLDGTAVTTFTPFPGNPSWAYTQISVDPGEHELLSDGPIQTYSYGFGYADAYTNNLGYTQVEDYNYLCLEIERNGVLCVDSLQQFTYNSDLEVGAFEWDFGDGNFSAEAEPTHVYTAAGAYDVILIATAADGTTLMASLTVTVVEDCNIDCTQFFIDVLTIEGFNCTDSLQTLNAAFSEEPDAITWLLPDGSEQNTLAVETVIGSEPGSYPVTLRASWDNGCADTMTISQEIEECLPPEDCAVMIPNIFSPNNDGVNDRFRVFFAPACAPEAFELFVYNRWGSEVYRSNKPTEGWDGRFNGKIHPASVLIYWCRLTLPDGQVLERKGDVTLVR